MIEHHLRAMMSQGKNSEALAEYKRMETMFFDVLGVSFSDSLRAMHSQIQHPDQKHEIPLESLLEEWLKDADFPGAYYCDAGIFKTLYQIESRSVPRSGRMAFVVRFDTKYEPNAKDGGVMKQLGTAIHACLRMGDLFTRYSSNQYLILLYSLTYEDCKMLINRILRSVDSKHLSKIVGTSMSNITPMGL
jgi:hypothetical protein